MTHLSMKIALRSTETLISAKQIIILSNNLDFVIFIHKGYKQVSGKVVTNGYYI